MTRSVPPTGGVDRSLESQVHVQRTVLAGAGGEDADEDASSTAETRKR